MIGKYVFDGCALDSIDIPSSVEEIRERAFANSNVKNVVFSPDSKLRKIGKEAFQGCALEVIDIPSSVEIIEEAAFENCVQLRSVFLPSDSKRRKISPNAFRGCDSLKNIAEIIQ